MTIQTPPVNAPLTQGFWKTHTGFGPQADAWPNGTFAIAPGVTYVGSTDAQGRAAGSMTFGGHPYSFTDLQTIFATPVKGDALINLGHQLIAAILNVANGAGTPGAISLIQQASDLLAANHLVIGVDQVKAGSPLDAQFIALASGLEHFNSSGD